MTEPLDSPEPVPVPGEPHPAPVGRSLAHAVVTGAALLVVVAVCFALGERAFFALICVVVVGALLEVFDTLRRSGRQASTVIGLTAGLALQGAAYSGRAALLVAVAVAGGYASWLWALRARRGPQPASDAAWTIFAVAWVGGGGAAAVGVLGLPGGLGLLVAFVLVAAAADIAAYFVGTRLGRRRMAPSISPGKSWEGCAGGLAAAVGAGVVAGALLAELALWQGLALGALVGALGPLGDLVESVFKREMGLKHSGRVLPGHGGLLDRIDAMVFSAPAAFLLFSLIV
ncbi:hypothetical protein BH18ACT15_BH18ACT15_06200 [soil metagenome]